MTVLTTRSIVIEALARREAELLGHAPAGGHVLVALIWDAQGTAARALAEAGVGEEQAPAVRAVLSELGPAERGSAQDDVLGAAWAAATALGHDYIGTEHLMLALADDSSLSESLLSPRARATAVAATRRILAEVGITKT